jgi:hypothetical protein
MQIGEELFLRVTNSTGSAIPKGSVVYITGSTGSHVNVVLSQANSEGTSSKTLGITAETIANAQTGFVATNGIVSGLDTSTLTEGGAVWLSATVAGGLTSTRPSPPDHAVLIGWCVKSHASVGALYIHIANGYEVAELHDVLLTSIANNQVLSYESASGLWKNRSLATVANTGAFSDILSKPTTLSGYGITDAPTVTGTGASGTWGISITGNAATATTWETGRTIALTGDVTGTSGTFNGSANLSFATTLANSGVTAGTYTKVTVDAKGRVTGGTNPTNLSGYGITDALSSSATSTQSGYFGDIFLYDDSTPSHYLQITNSANLTLGRVLNLNVNDADRTISLSGNLTVSAAATVSGTNTGDQTITLTGDVTGSGTGSFATTLANSGVAAGTYGGNNSIPSITFDAKGRATAASTVTPSGTWGISITGTSRGVGTTDPLIGTGGLWVTSATGLNVARNGTAYVALDAGNYSSYALPLTGGTLTGALTAPNFRDSAGAFNVNLGSGGTEGRGAAVGYSGGAYGGIGYNVRHTATSEQYVAPTGDTVSYLRFDGGGFRFFSAAAGAAGRTVTFSAPGNAHLDASGNWYTAGQMYATGSQHLVLNTGNYNSYAPTLTGTGASGSWGISVTGNAGTATTLQTARTINGTSFNGSANITTANWGTARTITIGSTGKSVDGSGNVSWTLGEIGAPSTTDAMISRGSVAAASVDTATLNGFYTQSNVGDSDGLLVFNSGGSLGPLQMYFKYSGIFQWRNKTDSTTWTAWKTVLHSANYNSYSPTLTGGGASGTWSINVTGSAGLLSALGNYVLYASTNGRDFANGIQAGFVDSGTNGYPNYGSIVRIKTYPNDGGAAELYFPYGASYGGSAMRYRLGQYNNAGWTSWKTVLDDSNYSSYALPLSGGTISGTVSINGGSSQPLNLTTSSSGPWGFGLTRSDANVSSKIFLHNGSGSWAWVYEHNPVFYNGGAYSQFLNSSNYSSYALPLSGGTMTGGLGVGAIIGSRGTALSVSCSSDSSAIVAKSSSYATVSSILPHSSSWTYYGTGVYYNNGTWVHASADSNNALFGINGSIGAGWWSSNNSSASWNVAQNNRLWDGAGTWVGSVNAASGAQVNGSAILSAANYSSYALPLSGGTLSGSLSGTSATFSGEVKFGATGPHNSGNPRSLAIGWSGGNYGAAGYGITYTGTSGVHNYAFNDIVSLWEAYDGLIVRSAAGGAVGTPITWTTVLDARRNNTALSFKGNTVLDSSNYSSYALPLSGGTLTGSATISGNGYGLYFTGGNNRIYFSGYRAIEGATNGSQLQIGEGYSGTYLQSANIYATTSNHVVLHAGNYTSYSPSLGGSGASGTWGINITGNAGSVGSRSPGGSAGNLAFYDGSNGYLYTPTWIGIGSGSGLFSSNGVAGAHFYPSNATYGAWRIDGSNNGWGGIAFGNGSAGIVNLMTASDSNSTGFHNQSYGWQFQWANGVFYIAKNAYGGNMATALDSSNYNSYSPTLTGGNASGSWNITAARATRANGNFYIDDNYGCGIVGAYASTRYQGVFAMGDSYKLPADGTSAGNLYGIAWSYPSAGGVAGNLDSHGMLVLINGGFGSCMSYSIVAAGNVTAYSDERLKTNWRPMPENFVERLAQVKVGIYDRIDGEQITQVGIGAQSFQKLLPEAITKAKDEMGTLSVSYGNAAMASAVELAKEIVAIKRELEALKAKLH